MKKIIFAFLTMFFSAISGGTPVFGSSEHHEARALASCQNSYTEEEKLTCQKVIKSLMDELRHSNTTFSQYATAICSEASGYPREGGFKNMYAYTLCHRMMATNPKCRDMDARNAEQFLTCKGIVNSYGWLNDKKIGAYRLYQ